MKSYIIKRLILSVFTVLFVVSMVYLLLTYSGLVRWTRGVSNWDMIVMTFDSYKEFVKEYLEQLL